MDSEKLVLKANGFNSFNPMQEKVVKSNWKEKNLVVSSPTASGKTVVAELFALNSILSKRKKVLFTCPLRALASEHFNEFKEKYSDLFQLTLSTGDFDSSSKYLSNYDLIFCTNEKLESLLRHRAGWLSNVGALIIDEIHEIDSRRGPTIEIIITKLKLLNPNLHLLALSATIPNGKELSEWLSAQLIESDYRPVKLSEGVYFDSEIKFSEKIEFIEHKNEPVKALVEDVLNKKKQALIFANTRKSSEATAKKLAPVIEKTLSLKEKKELNSAAEKALNALENPTEQCKTISSLIKKGICFHNAGILSKQRKIIEDLFRENKLKAISATPTLTMGVNLPAFRVIIPTLFRYTSNGMEKIPVREYKQLAGRAGRPKFDSFGEAVIVARSFDDAEKIQEEFIEGEIEKVQSHLGSIPLLRTLLLSAIATDYIYDLASAENFFSKTFYAYQFKEMNEILKKIQDLLIELNEMQFIELNEKNFTATKIGKRVSELYLDPLTAFKFIKGLKAKAVDSFYFLYLFADSTEMIPYLSVTKSNEFGLWEELQKQKQVMPIKVDLEMFTDHEILNKFNLAKALNEWINEASEQKLMKDFNLMPGILFNKIQIIDWLNYSAIELSNAMELNYNIATLNKLRKRIKKGVKEELIYLTELRGIGRVRARKLFNAGLREINQIKDAPVKKLAELLGAKTALQIKKQLGIKLNEKEILSIKGMNATIKQKGLNEF
ncbi:MAG: DEAD/DEAH box helicase [Candidatus Diapherotrites archaeon]|nr:DEAD/DEAH box helicase [Candidatus Diapherotrites archaeon]